MNQIAMEPQPPVADVAPGEWPPSLWRVAARNLRRNRTAMVALGVLLLVVVLCLAAPLYAAQVAGVDAFEPNLTGTVEIDGRDVKVIGGDGATESFVVLPIGPTWQSAYFLGADARGRDVMSLVLHGGRTTLYVGGLSALLCCLVGTAMGLAAGFFRGVVDAVLSRVMDIIWGFPFYFLAISLASVLLVQRFELGPIRIDGSSKLVPTLVIAYVYIPYVARPIRTFVMSLREREFVDASVVSGASSRYIVVKEVMPNVLPVAITLLPIMMSRTVLTEASLSFLGVGVQPPDVSWGTIINEGQRLLYSRPWISLAPGLMLTITLVALSVFGEAVRGELDRRGRVKTVGAG